MRNHNKITIIRIGRPPEEDVNAELQWLGSSLGLFNMRDKDRSCFRVFIELVKSSRKEIPLSSDEIGYKTGLSRGTVVHHINKLMESGIVLSDRNKYILRVSNLRMLIDEIEKDIDRAFDDLREVAEKIDKGLGFK